MDNCILAINNMFASSTAVELSSLRSLATEDTKAFTFTLAKNQEMRTTDNSATYNVKSCPTSNQSQDLDDASCRKTALQKPDESVDKAKKRVESSNEGPYPAKNSEQYTCVQESPTAGVALVKDSVVIIDSDNEKQKRIINPNKAAQLIKSSCLNKLTPFLNNISKELNAAQKKQEEAKNVIKAHISNSKDIITKSLIEAKNGQELMKKVSAGNSQKTATEEKLTTVDNIMKSFAGLKKSVSNDSITPNQGKSVARPSRGSAILAEISRAGSPCHGSGQAWPSFHGLEARATQKAMVSPKKYVFIDKKTTDSVPFTKSTDYNISDRKALRTPLDSNGAKLSDNLSGNSLSQKLNLTELQISKGQNKACGELVESNGGSSTQNWRTSVLDSRFFASNNTENPASSIEFGKFLNPTQATNTVNPSGQVSISDISKSIGEQIIESIHASLQQQNKQITIRLNPPDLGMVFVKLQEQREQIIGLLEVSKEQTKYEIEQALPQMLRILADSGIHIKRFEVQHNNQPEQQADKFQSLADSAWESAGENSFQKGNSGNTFTSEAAMDTYSYDDTSGMTVQIHKQSALDGFVTDISINMLM